MPRSSSSKTRKARDQVPTMATRHVTRSGSVEPQHSSYSAPARRHAADTAVSVQSRSMENLDERLLVSRNLSTVHEDHGTPDDDDDDEIVVNPTNPNNNSGLTEVMPEEEDDRESSASGLSGSTAGETSFSQEEIERLEPDMMLDALPTLYAAAEAVRKSLTPAGSDTTPDVWKDIRTAGSRQQRQFETRLAAIDLYKPHFGSEEYIQPRNVIRAMLGVQAMVEVPTAVWRPDNVLFGINLVRMLYSLLITCDPGAWTEAGLNALERLDAAFPKAIAGPQFDLVGLKFYLSLVAQLAIARLEAHLQSEPTFSPSDVIENVLYDDDHSFKHATLLGLDDIGEVTRDQALSELSQLERNLKHPFTIRTNKNNAAGAIAKLKSKFQWSDFTHHALRYFTYRKNVLDDRIAAAGGPESIVDGLTQELQRRAQLKASGREVDKYLKRKSTASISSLKALEKELMGTEMHPPASAPVIRLKPTHTDERLSQDMTPSVYPVVVTAPPKVVPTALMTDADGGDDPYIPFEDQADDLIDTLDGAETADDPSATARSTLQAISALQEGQRQAQIRTKPRSMLDRQPNAVRVSWDDSQATQRPSPPPVRRSPLAARKRGIAEIDEEDEEDEEDEPQAFDPTPDAGFQSDARKLAVAHRRREELQSTLMSSLPLESSHTSQNNDPTIESVDPSASMTHASDFEPEAKRPRKNPGSSIPPLSRPDDFERDDLPASTMFQMAKVAAKRNRAAIAQSKPQQIRTPWVDKEEEVLLGLIEKYCDEGISWRDLKNLDMEQDDHLKYRSAEDLRFKARNMKTTLLLGHADLPRNWEKVILDKKAIDKLHASGIPYHQERQRAPVVRDR